MHPHMLPPLQTQGLKMSPTALLYTRPVLQAVQRHCVYPASRVCQEVLASKHEDTKINPDVLHWLSYTFGAC